MRGVVSLLREGLGMWPLAAAASTGSSVGSERVDTQPCATVTSLSAGTTSGLRGTDIKRLYSSVHAADVFLKVL